MINYNALQKVFKIKVAVHEEIKNLIVLERRESAAELHGVLAVGP